MRSCTGEVGAAERRSRASSLPRWEAGGGKARRERRPYMGAGAESARYLREKVAVTVVVMVFSRDVVSLLPSQLVALE